MTHTDLKEAAEKATPGPWVFIPAGNRPQIFAAKNMDIMIARVESLQFVEDAAFVAIANPARILSLLDEIQSLREALTPFAAFVDEIEAHETARQAADSFVIHEGLTVGDFRRARAALKEKPHD